MKHNIPVPDITELEALIAPACDGIPGPDPVRLQSIRDRLPHAITGTRSQKSLNKLPWWTVLLLTGGLAAAAGWYTGVFSSQQGDSTIPQTKQSSYEDVIIPHEKNQNMQPRDPQSQELDNGSPVIYQRE